MLRYWQWLQKLAHTSHSPLTGFETKPFAIKATPATPLTTAKTIAGKMLIKDNVGVIETETGAHILLLKYHYI
ncbi:MAG: hypothetical protein DRO98_01530 [Archaeoglobales archaeon]|nr:MAG: hypothetical protein DRO98_01530 [Archaeoglobales archaeon]